MMHPLEDFEVRRRKLRATDGSVQRLRDNTTSDNKVIVDRDNKTENETPKYER